MQERKTTRSPFILLEGQAVEMPQGKLCARHTLLLGCLRDKLCLFILQWSYVCVSIFGHCGQTSRSSGLWVKDHNLFKKPSQALWTENQEVCMSKRVQKLPQSCKSLDVNQQSSVIAVLLAQPESAVKCCTDIRDLHTMTHTVLAESNQFNNQFPLYHKYINRSQILDYKMPPKSF